MSPPGIKIIQQREGYIDQRLGNPPHPLSKSHPGVTSLFWPMLANAACSASKRMLTAVDLKATGVIVNKQFLNVTYNPSKYLHRQ